MSQFRNIKIKVGSQEASVAIQEFLFQNGCGWGSFGKAVRRTDADYLFVDEYGILGWDNCTQFFNNTTDYEEMTFVTSHKLVVTSHALKERPKTVLFGKTYYTDELNTRLEGLKTC